MAGMMNFEAHPEANSEASPEPNPEPNPGPNLAAMQAALVEAGLDGWLFYDHHHRDPIAARILHLDEKALVTRRWYYFVPAAGEPRKLVHRIEQGRLDRLPGAKALYSRWQERAPWPCSTRPITPSCTSRWWTPERSNFCAGWASGLSVRPTWSAALKPF
jgi:hypothetical protein